jgi:fructose-1,6-bisphosphatase
MNSLQWYIVERHDLEIKSRTGEILPDQYGLKLISLENKAREMYRDEIEAAIIKDCATESTSAAHNKEVHRQQIIAAYIAAKMERNKVKKHFAYFLKLDRVQIAAQEYYNENYGDGVQ